MASENDLLVKCLDIAKHVVNNNLITTMIIKVGKEFSFEFTNSELIKKKLSPSQNKRNLDRREHFLETKMNKKADKVSKATIDVRVAAVQTENESKDVAVQTIENNVKHETKVTQTFHSEPIDAKRDNLKTCKDDDTKAEVSKATSGPRSLQLDPSYKCYLCGQISQKQ